MKEKKTLPWSTKQLMRMREKGTLAFDLKIQRNEVWTNEKKSKLIRSIINDFPSIPAVYCTKDTESRIYQCIDGKQRCTTVFHFMNNEFALEDVDSVIDDDGNEIELQGKTYDELPEEFRDAVANYTWLIFYYDDLTEDEEKEMFYLLNNGQTLTRIEHSRSICPSLDKIKEICSKCELFDIAFTEKAKNKYTDEDFVIKSYEMLQENPSLEAKVIRPLTETIQLTEDDTYILETMYDIIYNAYNYIVSDGKDKTRNKIAKRLIKRIHLLSVIPLARKCIEIENGYQLFAEWCLRFFNGEGKDTTISPIYNSRCVSGSNQAGNVEVRVKEVKKDFDEFLATKDLGSSQLQLMDY